MTSLKKSKHLDYQINSLNKSVEMFYMWAYLLVYMACIILLSFLDVHVNYVVILEKRVVSKEHPCFISCMPK